jgi:hypothetical protein
LPPDGPKDSQTNVTHCRRYLQKSLPILNEVLLTVTLGRRPLKIWIFVAHITNEFILGLDILCAYGASVDFWRQTLHLAEEKVSQWSPAFQPGTGQDLHLTKQVDVGEMLENIQ